ncbi:MAG TPA: hypothetical protein VKP59_05520 [Candidatus Thermoplasmatota archaeon]|nr:hypothetical protein [Candidatus Thermoplasmatota archaeon]
MKPFFIWVSIPLEVTLNLPQKKTREKITAAKDDTINSVVTKLGFDPDTVVILYKKKPIPETTKITEDMDLTILEITSKG